MKPAPKNLFGEVEPVEGLGRHVGPEFAVAHPEAMKWLESRDREVERAAGHHRAARGQGRMTKALWTEVHQLGKAWMARRPTGGFRLIMIDPPWHFSGNSAEKPGRNARGHYKTKPIEWIKALPINGLMADDAILWLWATNPNLIECMDAAREWGLAYSTGGVWVKTTKKGKPHIGGGHFLRGCSEPFLIYKKGKPKVVDRGIPGAILEPRREHSRKPEQGYEYAARMCPDGPRADIFTRQRREGWTPFGDQVDFFPQDAPTEGVSPCNCP